MFKLFDINGDGKISISDLKKTAEQIGNTIIGYKFILKFTINFIFQKDPNLEEDELNEMFDEADLDQDGFISYEEFHK